VPCERVQAIDHGVRDDDWRLRCGGTVHRHKRELPCERDGHRRYYSVHRRDRMLPDEWWGLSQPLPIATYGGKLSATGRRFVLQVQSFQ
jgi:hypothetical protein